MKKVFSCYSKQPNNQLSEAWDHYNQNKVPVLLLPLPVLIPDLLILKETWDLPQLLAALQEWSYGPDFQVISWLFNNMVKHCMLLQDLIFALDTWAGFDFFVLLSPKCTTV